MALEHADGLAEPLLCGAYFDKIAILFGCSVPCHNKCGPIESSENMYNQTAK